MIGRTLAFVVAVAFVACRAGAARPQTFCNPINLDYGIYQARAEPPHRHGADPVVVLFNDRYWLFSTWDRPGYRVSDDLVNWKYIPFGRSVALPDKRGYTAAAAVVMNGWMYFTEYGKSARPVAVYRTRHPADGESWEKFANQATPYADPCLFLDAKSNRLFMYYGLEKPMRGVELDRKTFAEIPGTQTQLMPALDPSQRISNGWEICTWDNSQASKPMRGNRTFFPCREGAWVTWFNDRYYLQYASPGTTVPGYADGLLMGNSPLGPFEYSSHSPISRKDSGFITSAGHGCLFQDKAGNWWRAVTMLIGVHERMERRIGLFPAGFDSDGVPFTRTELDVPITLEGEYATWRPISYGRLATASSSLEDHPPAHAADEDIRTWWSAKGGGADEWLQLDLGVEREIEAVQINLYEQDVAAPVPFEEDLHRFVLAMSKDGQSWNQSVYKGLSNGASPHTYIDFDEPIAARYLKLRNVEMPGGGKVAVSDLRVFGNGKGSPPAPVTELSIERDPDDRRQATLSWQSGEGASEFLIRYGIAKEKLYLSRLVRGGEGTSITLFSLNQDPPYFFRVDALNDVGKAVGETVVEAP